MNREEALELVAKHLKNKNLVKHCLAVEACMKALASRLNQDVGKWGLAGVLHDLDYEITEKSPELHTTETVKILKELNVDPDIIQAILDGREPSGVSLEKLTKNLPLDWAEQRAALGFPAV